MKHKLRQAEELGPISSYFICEFLNTWAIHSLKGILFIFSLLLVFNPQVYLLGYGARLFCFDFGGDRNTNEDEQKNGKEGDISSVENINNGPKRNNLSSLVTNFQITGPCNIWNS